MSAFVDLLGPTLQDSKGNSFPTAKRLDDVDAVALYFSAHWCGPCRGFTPQLANTYNTILGDGKKFEIVFVSSDKDDSAFTEYLNEMPWVALPFADRERKAALSKKFKVQGIPTLVILNKDGTTITSDGRSSVSSDPKGEKFPWVPPTFHESLGNDFVRNDGTHVSFDDLKGKVLGLYFSAHWCPPCRGFTPGFAETYKKVQAAFPGKFEVVFVSSDKDDASFKEYHNEMPWLALPFADRSRKAQLSERYGVSGIPSLVIVDADSGEVINGSARGAVTSDKNGESFPWAPKPVQDLASPDGINESTSIIVLAEQSDEATRKSLHDQLMVIAEQSHAKSKASNTEKYLFFFAGATSDVSKRIRTLTKIGDPTSSPQVVLIDIPDNGGFYTLDSDKVDSASIAQFVSDFESKALSRKQLN